MIMPPRWKGHVVLLAGEYLTIDNIVLAVCRLLRGRCNVGNITACARFGDGDARPLLAG